VTFTENCDQWEDEEDPFSGFRFAVYLCSGKLILGHRRSGGGERTFTVKCARELDAPFRLGCFSKLVRKTRTEKILHTSVHLEHADTHDENHDRSNELKNT
jgi:hypothetical protein